MRTKCHLDLWTLSPCEFRQGHMYTHAHIVISCLQGKRDFSTRYVWDRRRTSTIPRVFVPYWEILYGTFVFEYVNMIRCYIQITTELLKAKTHFSRRDSVRITWKHIKFYSSIFSKTICSSETLKIINVYFSLPWSWYIVAIFLEKKTLKQKFLSSITLYLNYYTVVSMSKEEYYYTIVWLKIPDRSLIEIRWII